MNGPDLAPRLLWTGYRTGGGTETESHRLTFYKHKSTWITWITYKLWRCLLVCLLSLCKGRCILSLDCQSTLLLHDSWYGVLLMKSSHPHESRQVDVMSTVVSYCSRDHR